MKINYYFLFLLLILSSCEKRENIEMSTKNSENHTLKGRLSSLGFNQIDPGKLQKGISYHEIASDDELNTLLDQLENKSFPTLKKISVEANTKSNQSYKISPNSTLSQAFSLSEESGGGGGSFGPGLAFGVIPIRVSFFANYSYPWCDLDVEVAMTKNAHGNVTGHLVTVNATSGIGGFNLNSSTASSQQTNSVLFSFSGILYCGIHYQGNYYGSSGTITVEGHATTAGGGRATFTPMN